MDRSEFSGERFLIFPTRDRDCFESHFRRELHPEMPKPADAEHRHDIARTRAAVPERVERRHPGAHERRTINRTEIVRN